LATRTSSPKAKAPESIEIRPIHTNVRQFWLLGTSPLILNRMSEKSRHDIIFPRITTNRAARASRLKHDPMAEFQAAPYRLRGEDEPTLLAIMASAVKGAMMTAALDTPGANKAQTGRLATVLGEYVHVWGEPKLFMSVVRSADMKKTPDIRTRVIVPRWAVRADIQYVSPLLNDQSILNLLAAGGITAGIGDWRPEKGKGSYGRYVVVNQEDENLAEVLSFGRVEQQRGMAAAEPYDEDTRDLLDWFNAEIKTRGVQDLLEVFETDEDDEEDDEEASENGVAEEVFA
jgi:hypothetical protein